MLPIVAACHTSDDKFKYTVCTTFKYIKRRVMECFTSTSSSADSQMRTFNLRARLTSFCEAPVAFGRNLATRTRMSHVTIQKVALRTHRLSYLLFTVTCVIRITVTPSGTSSNILPKSLSSVITIKTLQENIMHTIMIRSGQRKDGKDSDTTCDPRRPAYQSAKGIARTHGHVA